ncbi:MAG: putative ATPase involved in repair [Herminiimonas sp.]|nr:putative ATPase involved in repair [Herminiimonas sp.]
MNTIRLKRISIAIAALAALSLTTAACAQYVWLNEKGVKQYSDMPPPSSVPKNRILKDPGMSSHSMAPLPAENPAESDNRAVAESPKDKGPMTTAEKNAEFQKRKIEQAEKDKKAAEQEKLAADKAKNCEQARAYNRNLQSGERIARTDKNGERYYLTDEQRTQETRDTRRVLDECK